MPGYNSRLPRMEEDTTTERMVSRVASFPGPAGKAHKLMTTSRVKHKSLPGRSSKATGRPSSSPPELRQACIDPLNDVTFKDTPSISALQRFQSSKQLSRQQSKQINRTFVNLPQKRRRAVDFQRETTPTLGGGGGGKWMQRSVPPRAKWLSLLQRSMNTRRKVDHVAVKTTGMSDVCSNEMTERRGKEDYGEGMMQLDTPLEDSQFLGGDTQEWGCSQMHMGSQSWEIPGPSQDWGYTQDLTSDQGYLSPNQRLDKLSLLSTSEDDDSALNGPERVSTTFMRDTEVEGCSYELQKEKVSALHSCEDVSRVLDEGCSTIEPISVQKLGNLHKLQTGRDILVAGRVVLNSMGSGDYLELIFLDGESMSHVLGVGIDHSKVRMTSGAKIELIRCEQREWELLWAEALDENHSFKILAVKVPEPLEEQSLNFIAPSNISEKFGVAVDCPGKGVVKYGYGADEPQKEAGEAEPLVWELAKHLLKDKGSLGTGRQHTAPESERGQQNQGNPAAGTDLSSSLNIPGFFSLKIGSSGGENGDEDEDSSGGFRKGNAMVAKADQALSLRVIVRPGRGGVINSTEFGVSPPKSLAKVSKIFPTLTFDFEKQNESKSISVEILAECPLGDGGPNAREKDRFGWYHDHIYVSLKCQNEDTSVLETYGIMDKGEIVRGFLATNSTNSINTQLQHQASLSASIPCVGGISLAAQSSANRNNGVSDSIYEGYELASQRLMEGFSSCDRSSMGEARLAYEFSFQTEVPRDVWRQSNTRRWFAQSGISSTLKPKLRGTWEPLDEEEHSSYLFEVSRELVERFKDPGKGVVAESGSREFLQLYVVPLFVNHAMSHLNQVRRRNHVINEKVKEIPRVILLGHGIL